jgi:hypothetical protein
MKRSRKFGFVVPIGSGIIAKFCGFPVPIGVLVWDVITLLWIVFLYGFLGDYYYEEPGFLFLGYLTLALFALSVWLFRAGKENGAGLAYYAFILATVEGCALPLEFGDSFIWTIVLAVITAVISMISIELITTAIKCEAEK